MDRNEWGQGAAARLYDAEAKVDLAIADLAGLTGYLAAGRVEQALVAKLGQDTLSELTEAQRGLIETRARLLNAHQAMRVTARAAGLQWRLNGPLESPDDEPREKPAGHLKVVA